MWLAIVAVFVVLAILLWSADVFINGATALAKQLHVPTFLVGMLILGFGSSAPEMVVAVLAALQGSPELALGNAYGSNIFNTLGVVGLAAVIAPISANPMMLSRDILTMASLTVLLFGLSVLAFISKRQLERASGITLVLCFIGYTFWLIQTVSW